MKGRNKKFFLLIILDGYMKLIVRIWIWLGLSLRTVGETIETYIELRNIKMQYKVVDIVYTNVYTTK